MTSSSKQILRCICLTSTTIKFTPLADVRSYFLHQDLNPSVCVTASTYLMLEDDRYPGTDPEGGDFRFQFPLFFAALSFFETVPQLHYKVNVYKF